MKCFFHRADLDGHCSGAIVRFRHPECEMIGIDYGDPFPWERLTEEEDIYLVDFSLQPWSEMERLHRVNNRVIWIDHHKTAIEQHAAGPPLFHERVLDARKAACELTWEHLFPEVPIPRAVHLLGRYDIWEHHNVPGSLEFQYGMRNMGDTSPDSKATMSLWHNLFFDQWVDWLIERGANVLYYERERNERIVKALSFECELDGLRCLAANVGLSNSLLFESIWDSSKYDAMLTFCWRGGAWHISLYSDREDVDCGAVCQARGGGGHKGAAGFQCKELPFLPGGREEEQEEDREADD